MEKIRNPILPGFNPDPSILRVGEDYYIATSTFEWWPGVQIHHSRDLVHWRLLARPLNRLSLLDLKGRAGSSGVWAPCLTHDGDRFHLAYTDVHGVEWPFWSHHNYLTTAPSIEGPWSDPVYQHSWGFDPSVFHDEDGRKYLLSMHWDYRTGENCFAGIVMCELSRATLQPMEEPRLLWKGTALNVTEGPHLYRKDGWFYLLCAEGGTHWGHAASVARSRELWGPYENHPRNPILTSRGKPRLALQKAGHASFVSTPGGQWYLAHLCGRPVRNPEFGDGKPSHREFQCILGRETALQAMEWDGEGWPRLAQDSDEPGKSFPAPRLPSHPWPALPAFDDFDSPALASPWQTLREPADASWLSLTERPGFLRLRGRNFLRSRFDQSLVARRVEALHCEAACALEFHPENFRQSAGLCAYYDASAYAYLSVTRDAGALRLRLWTNDFGEHQIQDVLELPEGTERHLLRAVLDGPWLQFYYGPGRASEGRVEGAEYGTDWRQVGPRLNASLLSDDAADNMRFTGLFWALCAQDLDRRLSHADFDWFHYRTG